MSKKSKYSAQLSFDWDAIDIDELAQRWAEVVIRLDRVVADYRTALEGIAGCSLDDWPLETLLSYGDLALAYGKQVGYIE